MWTVLGVILAVVIAWVVVDVLLSIAWLAFRIGIVAVVAVVVFLALRVALSRGRR